MNQHKTLIDFTLSIKAYSIILFRYKLNLWNPLSLISLVIRWVTGSRYNHVGIIIPDKDILYVYESTKLKGRKAGVIKTELTRRLSLDTNSSYKVAPLLLTPEQKVNVTCKALGALERIKYDTPSLLYWYLLWRITGRWFGSKKRLNEKMQCAEFVGYVLNLPNNHTLDAQDFELFYQFTDEYKS